MTGNVWTAGILDVLACTKPRLTASVDNQGEHDTRYVFGQRCGRLVPPGTSQLTDSAGRVL